MLKGNIPNVHGPCVHRNTKWQRELDQMDVQHLEIEHNVGPPHNVPPPVKKVVYN